jgi:hypothetical protein
MSDDLAFYLSLSILVPIVVGITRYKAIYPTYYPFLVLMLVGLINEIVCYPLSNSAIPNNVYCLIEFLLFTWQFRKWKNILLGKEVYYGLNFLLIIIWMCENLVYKHLDSFGIVYAISYSFTLILLAINQMNWLIINERSSIYKNPVFIICIAIIIFYSYKILMEVFYYYAPERTMRSNIFSIEAYVNVLYNILLAIAIICIPKKKNFILQLS